jgi:hypothetical protein
MHVSSTSSHTRRQAAALEVRDGLWRITRRSGEVLGYVERVTDLGGDRFRAKRYAVRTGAFTPVGDFWRVDDAVDALRFA